MCLSFIFGGRIFVDVDKHLISWDKRVAECGFLHFPKLKLFYKKIFSARKMGLT